MVRYHIIFKVGNLTGWVKNKIDGSVEMEVQGTEDNINDVLIRIKKGHGTIRVDEIKMKQGE